MKQDTDSTFLFYFLHCVKSLAVAYTSFVLAHKIKIKSYEAWLLK